VQDAMGKKRYSIFKVVQNHSFIIRVYDPITFAGIIMTAEQQANNGQRASSQICELMHNHQNQNPETTNRIMNVVLSMYHRARVAGLQGWPIIIGNTAYCQA
jgi:hypothetical protein